MIKAELVEKVSKKGTPYICIEVSVADKFKKLVFLNEAELMLIRMLINQPQK